MVSASGAQFGCGRNLKRLFGCVDCPPACVCDSPALGGAQIAACDADDEEEAEFAWLPVDCLKPFALGDGSGNPDGLAVDDVNLRACIAAANKAVEAVERRAAAKAAKLRQAADADGVAASGEDDEDADAAACEASDQSDSDGGARGPSQPWLSQALAAAPRQPWSARSSPLAVRLPCCFQGHPGRQW
jgi:hypothetical protein